MVREGGIFGPANKQKGTGGPTQYKPRVKKDLGPPENGDTGGGDQPSRLKGERLREQKRRCGKKKNSFFLQGERLFLQGAEKSSSAFKIKVSQAGRYPIKPRKWKKSKRQKSRHQVCLFTRGAERRGSGVISGGKET